ncbi:sce7726 family protein [Fundidesulfovibrio soli]|uniref:sce7726 family protein n=1 Tax=Fundidesulfovibrio soli TaxID=2922716 RepID=UPI001FAEF81D|nr:sce7726 family protein [Fundidesulfovibrio soli]
MSALTRLFSSAVFKELAKKGRSPLFTQLFGVVDELIPCGDMCSVGDVFDAAFSMIKGVGRRSEYVYKDAIVRKVLMGKHSIRTASLLNEFRAGSSKADIVVINGTATAYEIKSERDSLARLNRQIVDYRKVFANVNVITSEIHVDDVREVVPADVGILCLSRRYQISTVQEAREQLDRICPTTVFESLRIAEAASILEALGVDVPDVPNTQRYGLMRSCFARLHPVDVHQQMVKTLKRTRNLYPLSELLGQLPQSLQAAALSVPIRRVDYCRLIETVRTPLGIAKGWS